MLPLSFVSSSSNISTASLPVPTGAPGHCSSTLSITKLLTPSKQQAGSSSSSRQEFQSCSCGLDLCFILNVMPYLLHFNCVPGSDHCLLRIALSKCAPFDLLLNFLNCTSSALVPGFTPLCTCILLNKL